MNKFYQEITTQAFRRASESNLTSKILLTDSEIDRIKSLGFFIGYMEYSNYYILTKEELYYNIFPLNDEWFYLLKEEVLPTGQIRCLYYKCDQFEGVIKLLSEESSKVKLFKEYIKHS